MLNSGGRPYSSETRTNTTTRDRIEAFDITFQASDFQCQFREHELLCRHFEAIPVYENMR
jgi:hypothetical protein